MLIDSHTHRLSKNSQAGEIAIVSLEEGFEKLPSHFSVGVHPWRIADGELHEHYNFVEKYLSHKNCVAIGECGLDKKIATPMEIQKEVFVKHFEWAKKYQKPLIIHCVSAFQELIAIKKEVGNSVDCMVHGFSKNHQVATSLVKNGFYVSFGKALLKYPHVQEAFRQLPKNRIFLETDDANLSIKEVYEKANQLSDCTINQIIEENYKKVFKR